MSKLIKRKFKKLKKKILIIIQKIKDSIKRYFNSKNKIIKECNKLYLDNKENTKYQKMCDELISENLKLKTLNNISKSEIRKLKLELKKYEK